MFVKDIEWETKTYCEEEDVLSWYYLDDHSRITVLERTTGFSFAPFDIETGYRDTADKFWIASGMFDIRDYPELTVEEAIVKIKQNANSCIGE